MEAHHTSADGNPVYRFEITYEYAGERGEVEKETVQDELSESAARQLAAYHLMNESGVDAIDLDVHDVEIVSIEAVDE